VELYGRRQQQFAGQALGWKLQRQTRLVRQRENYLRHAAKLRAGLGAVNCRASLDMQLDLPARARRHLQETV
jgi:hypothetical protein